MDESLKSKEIIYAKKYARTFEQWIFGMDAPSLWVKMIFFLNLIIGIIFLCWHLLSWYALSTGELTLKTKGIDIVQLLQEYASKIGLDPGSIMNDLTSFQIASSIIWVLFLLNLILFWRRKLFAFWIHLILVLAYYGSILYFLNSTFFNQDISWIDKVLLGIVIGSLGIGYLLVYYQYRKFSKITKDQEVQSNIKL